MALLNSDNSFFLFFLKIRKGFGGLLAEILVLEMRQNLINSKKDI